MFQQLLSTRPLPVSIPSLFLAHCDEQYYLRGLTNLAEWLGNVINLDLQFEASDEEARALIALMELWARGSTNMKCYLGTGPYKVEYEVNLAYTPGSKMSQGTILVYMPDDNKDLSRFIGRNGHRIEEVRAYMLSHFNVYVRAIEIPTTV